jgi:hypothetical protein
VSEDKVNPEQQDEPEVEGHGLQIDPEKRFGAERTGQEEEGPEVEGHIFGSETERRFGPDRRYGPERRY